MIIPNETHVNINEGFTIHEPGIGNNLLRYVLADVLCTLKSCNGINLMVQADLLIGVY